MTSSWRRFLTIVPAALAVIGLGCTSAFLASSTRSIEDVVHDGLSDVFSVPFERYRHLDEDLPIGVFDSGIGGLSVLNEIVTIDRFDNRTHRTGPDGRPDFSDESFIYLGDQANMPYGNYPAEGKTDFLKELILKDVVFLLGDRYWPSQSSLAPRRDKPPVKAIVIACNTATAYGLHDIHRALERWGVPIFTVGVVAAGADGAVKSLGRMETPGTVAVMATVGTCASGGYPREILASAHAAGLTPPAVVQQGCLGLAGAIEGSAEYLTKPGSEAAAPYRGPAVGKASAPIDPSLIPEYGFEPAGILGNSQDPETWHLNSVENYIRYHTTTLVEAYRREGSSEPITTVILGCTHFPLYQDAIEASFDRLRAFRTPGGQAPYERLIADDIVFVDPANLTAVQLFEALARRELLNGGNGNRRSPADEFYISVANPSCPGVELLPDGQSFVYEYKYGRSPGELAKEYVKRVPMSRENLGEGVIGTIRSTMPAVFDRLLVFSSSSPRCIGQPAVARIDGTTS